MIRLCMIWQRYALTRNELFLQDWYIEKFSLQFIQYLNKQKHRDLEGQHVKHTQNTFLIFRKLSNNHYISAHNFSTCNEHGRKI